MSIIPRNLQAIGLACTPVAGLGGAEGRQPVAAAVVTLRTRDDGHLEVVETCVTDARAAEFPLPWLLNEALVAGASTLVSAEDRRILSLDMMARRYFMESRLAALCRGVAAIDPTLLPDGAACDEPALWKRLDIPVEPVSDETVQRRWNRLAPAAVEEIALRRAIARLIAWAHRASLDAANPSAFFETLTALRNWADIERERRPFLDRYVHARPMMWAASFLPAYREYRARRDGGDIDALWTRFEDGLFHT